MTSLILVPDLNRKTAKAIGTASVGEKVMVSIKGMGAYSNKNVRMRLTLGDRLLAIFPQQDGTGTWDSSEADVITTNPHFNLETVEALSIFKDCECPDAVRECVLIVDNPEDDQLYFYSYVDIHNWMREKGLDDPYDLSEYPDEVKKLQEDIVRYGKENKEFRLAVLKNVSNFQDSITSEFNAHKLIVSSAINGKANQTFVEGELAKKADKTDVADKLSLKADASSVYNKDEVDKEINTLKVSKQDKIKETDSLKVKDVSLSGYLSVGNVNVSVGGQNFAFVEGGSIATREWVFHKKYATENDLFDGLKKKADIVYVDQKIKDISGVIGETGKFFVSKSGDNLLDEKWSLTGKCGVTGFSLNCVNLEFKNVNNGYSTRIDYGSVLIGKQKEGRTRFDDRGISWVKRDEFGTSIFDLNGLPVDNRLEFDNIVSSDKENTVSDHFEIKTKDDFLKFSKSELTVGNSLDNHVSIFPWGAIHVGAQKTFTFPLTQDGEILTNRTGVLNPSSYGFSPLEGFDVGTATDFEVRNKLFELLTFVNNVLFGHFYKKESGENV